MDSYTSHLIASWFSSRHKVFSTKRINQYLKLNDYKNNNIDIFNLYPQSYLNKKIITMNEEIFNYSMFENLNSSNLPILKNGQGTPMYTTLHNLAH